MDTNTTDEHDLVKALDGAVASLGSSPATPASPAPAGDLSYEESTAPTLGNEPVVLPGSPVAPAPTDDPASTPGYLKPTGDSGPLEAIKKDALTELRPLVDKLNVSAEEKFDTYLLLIRSTDDKELIAPAHEAAKAIEDETRRAEALLDIIKEIDYLSHPKQ